VLGAVAESVTLRLFQNLYQARDIIKISERPDSKTADFAMDIVRNGLALHCLVESKGSNSDDMNQTQLNHAREQLEVTEAFHTPRADAKFASLVCFKSKKIVVVEVN
jgi:hypothetical protein